MAEEIERIDVPGEEFNDDEGDSDEAEGELVDPDEEEVIDEND